MKYLVPFLCASAFIAVNVEPMINKFLKKLAKHKFYAKRVSGAVVKSNVTASLNNSFPAQKPKEAVVININREQVNMGKLMEV